MPEPVVEIPDRPAFRASEVCEIAQIPPYVLKSWEKEFPGLGMVTKPGGPRVYRRGDVEQVVRIKHLLFAEGLTLAGARRKLEGEPKAEEDPLPDLTAAVHVRDKVAHIKQGLRSLLDLLSSPSTAPPLARPSETPPPADDSPQLWPPTTSAPVEGEPPAARKDEAPATEAAPELPLLSGVPEEPASARPRRGHRRSTRHSNTE